MSSKHSLIVKEIATRKWCSPLHTRSILIAGHDLYVFLEKVESTLYAMHMFFHRYKFGPPNNANCGLHPLSQFGLGAEGIYEVENSPWLHEFRTWNQNGPKYCEYGMADDKHIIVCFLDATLEILSSGVVKEIQISEPDLFSSLGQRLGYLESKNR